MGCFDYECECKGKTCKHVGGQLYGSTVVIEVPLSDHTVVYLKGEYEEYGYVTVGTYQFYPEQFEDYFEGWLEDESPDKLDKIFLATRVWTLEETVYTYEDDEDGNEQETRKFIKRKCFTGDHTRVSADITPTLLSKCIRLDKKIDLDELRQQRIKRLKSTIESLQKELGRKNRP
jgi:hypothetical protein